MAALSTLSNKGGLIDKICVARNEMVGVYGFVFHRGKTATSQEFVGYLCRLCANFQF